VTTTKLQKSWKFTSEFNLGGLFSNFTPPTAPKRFSVGELVFFIHPGPHTGTLSSKTGKSTSTWVGDAQAQPLFLPRLASPRFCALALRTHRSRTAHLLCRLLFALRLPCLGRFLPTPLPPSEVPCATRLALGCAVVGPDPNSRNTEQTPTFRS
jgi:hypothetical protein